MNKFEQIAKAVDDFVLSILRNRNSNAIENNKRGFLEKVKGILYFDENVKEVNTEVEKTVKKKSK